MLQTTISTVVWCRSTATTNKFNLDDTYGLFVTCSDLHLYQLSLRILMLIGGSLYDWTFSVALLKGLPIDTRDADVKLQVFAGSSWLDRSGAVETDTRFKLSRFCWSWILVASISTASSADSRSWDININLADCLLTHCLPRPENQILLDFA